MFSSEFDNYDITMCNNGFCSKKEQCHRFLAYKKYKLDPNEDKPMLVSMLLSNETQPFDGCNLFWQHKSE